MRVRPYRLSFNFVCTKVAYFFFIQIPIEKHQVALASITLYLLQKKAAPFILNAILSNRVEVATSPKDFEINFELYIIS